MLKIKLIKHLKAYKKGFLIGINVQPLPEKLYLFYNNIFFRILRVLGGFSAILVLSKNHLSLPLVLQYLVLILGLLQFIQMTIFSFLKSIYLYKKIKNNPEEFEVRNSPLHRYASVFAKLIACWKNTCSVGATGTSAIGTGLLIDNVLESARQPKVFDPIFKTVINSILPEQQNEIKKTAAQMQETIKKMETKNQEEEFIQEQIVNNLDEKHLVSIGFSSEEAQNLKKGAESLLNSTKDEKNQFIEEVKIKVEEWKNNTNK